MDDAGIFDVAGVSLIRECRLTGPQGTLSGHSKIRARKGQNPRTSPYGLLRAIYGHLFRGQQSVWRYLRICSPRGGSQSTFPLFCAGYEA